MWPPTDKSMGWLASQPTDLSVSRHVSQVQQPMALAVGRHIKNQPTILIVGFP